MGIFYALTIDTKIQKYTKGRNRTEEKLLETKAYKWGFRFLIGSWRKEVFYTKPL